MFFCVFSHFCTSFDKCQYQKFELWTPKIICKIQVYIVIKQNNLKEDFIMVKFFNGTSAEAFFSIDVYKRQGL